MKRIALQFGLVATAIIVLIQLSKYSLFTFRHSLEFIALGFAVAFIAVGILISRWVMPRFPSKKKRISSGAPETLIRKTDPDLQVKKLGISKREYEVLKQIALGKSNREIAETLFISENTVKTHVSNLLVKLDSKRRTQAVSKAKSLSILG